MNIKRIIPCLDIFNGRVVKGEKFKRLIDIGDPIEISCFYSDEGADEIVVLDISASIEKKRQMLSIINKISYKISIPLIVGGGIKSFSDFEKLLNSGADKISVNTLAIENSKFLSDINLKYGKQCLIVALDIKKFFIKNNFYYWKIYKKSGKIDTNLNIFDIIFKLKNIGVGEFLITSIDKDGTKSGFDLEFNNKILNLIETNIIASGGGGCLLDVIKILKLNNVNSVLLASLLHNKIYNIFNIKKILFENGIYTKF